MNLGLLVYPRIPIRSAPKDGYVIFGRDLLWELGISLYVQNNFISWKETKIPMISINCKMRTNFAIQESKNMKGATNRIKKILDAKYEKANLKEITTR